ncbi:LOW QUALITY PROTEIN: hypothetical protein Cgig2_002598 [Carnegiea gigantea]|uniref:Reverse transcriptase n=1 Tax=Carnegiea gigantea TaxID=171969 RepID=A0A9Q1JIQ6_9CARY|nr:LOW QUALITY PROTEIN: hypothetical protein Cgig2_002598 [Carnegiea gigantea]
MTEAWCILGDFNSVLYKEDRMGGNEILDHELEDLNNLLHTYELWTGAYFSWTNETIWSRINRVLINAYWFGTFEFTLIHYLTNGLSDHTPMLIEYSSSPKPKSKFQFYDMGDFLNKLRPHLKQLNRDYFADLRAQQDKAKSNIQLTFQHDQRNYNLLQEEKIARDRYVNILSSSISLMQQQCKVEWIKHGDDIIRFFFAKAKQKKLASYIFTIKDPQGNQVEAFE